MILVVHRARNESCHFPRRLSSSEKWESEMPFELVIEQELPMLERMLETQSRILWHSRQKWVHRPNRANGNLELVLLKRNTEHKQDYKAWELWSVWSCLFYSSFLSTWYNRMFVFFYVSAPSDGCYKMSLLDMVWSRHSRRSVVSLLVNHLPISGLSSDLLP